MKVASIKKKEEKRKKEKKIINYQPQGKNTEEEGIDTGLHKAL